jgi:phosphoribosylformylglycinamidine synthase
MKFGVVTFPGSNCEQDAVHALKHLGYSADYIWHQERGLASFDAIVLPGGFSYGDYLRCGAIARFSNVMEAVCDFAKGGGYVIGICNGFQVLTEAHLLPGALIRNKGLKFLCKSVPLLVENSVCSWINPEIVETGSTINIPIAHNEGNYICDLNTLESLRANKQIVLRYCEPDGTRLAGGSAENGALDDIAGICNEDGNVFGLMPHPERICDGVSGSTAGSVIFDSIAKAVS